MTAINHLNSFTFHEQRISTSETHEQRSQATETEYNLSIIGPDCTHISLQVELRLLASKGQLNARHTTINIDSVVMHSSEAIFRMLYIVVMFWIVVNRW